LAQEGGRRGAGGSGEGKTKEDFEDLRLTLQETDYGNFLQNEVWAHYSGAYYLVLISTCPCSPS
jgi:hypothetical protein